MTADILFDPMHTVSQSTCSTGDELYPENPDMVNGTNTMLEVDKTLNELYNSPNSNRFHIIFGDNLSVVCNISRFGQIQPVSRTIPISMETLHTKHKL